MDEIKGTAPSDTIDRRRPIEDAEEYLHQLLVEIGVIGAEGCSELHEGLAPAGDPPFESDGLTPLEQALFGDYDLADWEIRSEIVKRLRSELGNVDRVKIGVCGGFVTLSGIVRHVELAAEAGRIAAGTRQVRGVVNKIVAAPAVVKRYCSVRRSFKRAQVAVVRSSSHNA